MLTKENVMILTYCTGPIDGIVMILTYWTGPIDGIVMILTYWTIVPLMGFRQKDLKSNPSRGPVVTTQDKLLENASWT